MFIVLFYVSFCGGSSTTPEHSLKRYFAMYSSEGHPDQSPIGKLVEERRILEVGNARLLEILKSLGYPIETLGITTKRTLQSLDTNKSSERRDFRKEWDAAQAAIKQAEDEERRIRQAIEAIRVKRDQLSQERVKTYQEAFVDSKKLIAKILELPGK